MQLVLQALIDLEATDKIGAARHEPQTAAYRWSDAIQRQPWTAAIVGPLVLMLLAARGAWARPGGPHAWRCHEEPGDENGQGQGDAHEEGRDLQAQAD